MTDSDSENGSGDESEQKVTSLNKCFPSDIEYFPSIPSMVSQCLYSVFHFREFLLQSFAPLHYHLPHNIRLMAGASRCPLTLPVSAMMRGDQVEEGFQITGGRTEEKERVRTLLVGREEEECKPLLSPSLLASQSSPPLQLEGLHPHQ